MPLLSLTLATFLKAEFGFFGVTVKTFRQTPLLKGEGYFRGLFFRVLKPNSRAGLLPFFFTFFRLFFTNCEIVGIQLNKKKPFGLKINP